MADQRSVAPLRSRAFDGALTAVGVMVGLTFVVVELTRLPTADLPYFLGIPMIMIMCRFPMRFWRASGAYEIGFEFCVLIFLACTVDPVQALAVWSVGVGLGQLVTTKRIRARLFNIGIGITAGAVAVPVFDQVRGAVLTHPRELFAAGLAAAIYFFMDFVASGISIAFEERSSVRRQLAEPDALTALAAFLAISALGYLTALVVRELPAWSAVLVAAPAVTILVAVRARARGSEQARRLKVLLTTSTDVQRLVDERAVVDVLLAGAIDMLRDQRVELRSTPPRRTELGVLVHTRSSSTWLVAPDVQRVGASASDDHQGLIALVTVVEGALRRLTLTGEMTRLAWHDALTGLANRARFVERLDACIELEDRGGARSAVLFCDLDGFKRVNDMFGHVAGDELLVEVARRIKHCVREADTVARLGGDEFAVLLESVQDPLAIGEACDRILHVLRSRIHVLNEDVSITVTIGVAMTGGGESADLLLSQADMAMYHAKAKGKNRYETYLPALGDERSHRIELVEQLRQAIDSGHLEVYYQTVVDLRNRQAYGVEALVRWHHDGAFVSPDLFIPTAEESGLIIELGARVLEQVTLDAPKLRAAAGRRIAVGINVSAQQLQVEQFASQVLAARTRMGDIDLVLEVTERAFIDHDPRTLAAMTDLAAADVRFAVDDFGIGFSSIGYLKRLPVRILKIDKSFLDRIEDDGRACSLVRSMVVMGDALGLDVVVEGIERTGQLEHLTRHAHATIGQGYLFGRPMPVEDMIVVLSAEPTSVVWPPHPIDPGQSRLAASHRAPSSRTPTHEIASHPTAVDEQVRAVPVGDRASLTSRS
jgi:diguanylate cyclase (GGDEF)-like protein